ncbi:MAG: PAS domain-containing protein [Deltaproteobacteria bacterium]|nr:PAS domain-containing protein [Deltaproteobacteria bacterium]
MGTFPDGVEAASPPNWRRLWVRTALIGTGIILFVFGGYEIAERTVLRHHPPEMLSIYHMARGMGTAVLLGSWAFFSIMRTRKQYESVIAENVRRLEAEVARRTLDLERSHAFTELLFDSLRARIVVTDRDGRVVKANRLARESLGEDIIGQRCLDHAPECRARGTCAILGTFERNEVELDKETRQDSAGRIWVVDTYPVPDEEGKTRLVVEVARDVTEEKKLEAQIRHQEKMASLGLLAAGVAHDIGNPLASLSSELEILDFEDDISRFRESLNVLRGHVDRIGRTLREMVDFARRRSDRESDVDVSTAVADALRLVKHDPRARRVAVAVDVPLELPRVRMVQDDLVLVLVNLLINAVDAMPEGGTLEIHGRAATSGIELLVRDTGVGMTPEVRQRAIQPLFTTKEHGKGTGLGLSVAHDVLRSLGGTLDLESEPGKGTTVRMSFPAARMSLTPATRPAEVHHA